MVDAKVFNRASWVWPVEWNQPNCYMQFRHEFILADRAEEATFYISADSNYAFWINGEFISAGQFHDFPDQKSYDVFNIEKTLKQGKNILSVLAYYQGENSFQYIKGRPGLIYSLCTSSDSFVSGLETIYRPCYAYKSKNIERINAQRHFAFEYDARLADDWLSGTYVPPGDWDFLSFEDLYSVIQRPVLQRRPIRNLDIKEDLSVCIAAQGVFKRMNFPECSIASMMQRDFLSARKPDELFTNFLNVNLTAPEPLEINPPLASEDGVYILLDIGEQHVGFFDLDIDTAAGTVIDFSYGEHIDDLRVRAEIGGRNFANRYITSAGRQQFTHFFTRLSGRYIQLHISNISRSIFLYYAGLRNVEYPIDFKGRYESSCELQNKIYKTAVKTLHLCMHEHYEDSPWREQALYANDSRNQALCGYYCFGEYDFPKASWDLLGNTLNNDGYLELCAPAEIEITIPSFSMAWILGLSDYLDYSGDRTFSGKMWPIVQCMLDSWLATLDSGLLPTPCGERYWNFYEWASGLDGTEQGDCTKFHTLRNKRFDAPLNFWLALALEAGVKLANASGAKSIAEKYNNILCTLREKIHQTFFDNEQELYLTYYGDQSRPSYAELTQALALCANICPPKLAYKLGCVLTQKDSRLVKISLSQLLYKFQALLAIDTDFAEFVFSEIRDVWGTMLCQGSSTFWETYQGAKAFDNAGSLCHGWSAIPVYFYHGYLLGVRPLKPGFKRFLINPVKGVINECKGTIPTPSGAITLEWRRSQGACIYELSHPHNLKPVFLELSKDDIVICSEF